MDKLAHEHLGFRYQRVRSLFECKMVIAFHSPVSAIMEITREWFDAPKGFIPERRSGQRTVGAHAVILDGYDDSTKEFRFRNSWGPNWGDKGFGYISYRNFERIWSEGWFFYAKPIPRRTSGESGIIERVWGASEFGGGIFHVREIVGPGEDRMAWAFVIQRPEFLDIEELFVKPEHRHKGYGKALVRSIAKLAFETQQYPRAWVPYPDANVENLAILDKLFNPLGLWLRKVPVRSIRWAPFVFCAPDATLDPFTLQLPKSTRKSRRRMRKEAPVKD